MRQKLYAYVDETGQDTASDCFVVVTITSDEEQDHLRIRLMGFEKQAKTGARKWNKCHTDRSLAYLRLSLDQLATQTTVFFGIYRKPIPYFFPMLDVLEHAIKKRAAEPYTARVYVDGIDTKKAAELTNALRARGIMLEMVKSRRDESEPLIRFADRWAGCIRAAEHGHAPEKILLAEAVTKGRVYCIGPGRS
ncbi:MAG: hypothetical protein C5B50_28385 [Verrucomicrobia bacterium]|nr:MAG: hypothetical protein C5B50_28385 [Verrucomicrobiota bacterium]